MMIEMDVYLYDCLCEEVGKLKEKHPYEYGVWCLAEHIDKKLIDEILEDPEKFLEERGIKQ